ncbi:unnamed protein product [Merluccius merluccius]
MDGEKDEDLAVEDNPLYPPPPAYNPQPELDKNTSVPEVRVPAVSEDAAREALVKFVESKWRYSSKPARNMTFRSLKPVVVYRYWLETYTESRTSTWQFEPFCGQQVDGPQFGVSPPPWEILVSPPQRYTDQVQKARVPHSSFVKMCHKCNGCGRTRCTHCSGRGMKRCIHCHGNGRTRRNGKSARCTVCHGRGRKTCSFCHGNGHNTCSVCRGKHNLMHYIQLTITWKNNIDSFIPDRQPDFPDEKFSKVKGDSFFIDENQLVYPIYGFPDQDICDVSKKFITEHFTRFSSSCRILQQRQTIELVPLTHANYTFNGKNYDYFLYGLENKVYVSKYPTSCSIM